MSRLVSGYRELMAYKKARVLAREVFEISKSFPAEEKYALTDQLRRSSRAIGAQIAEAWGKRRYEKHFISKLTDAQAENYETQHWLETASDCGYLSLQRAKMLVEQCEEVRRLVGGMITKADRFCLHPTTTLREPRAAYYILQMPDP